jgi:hypothetical protein
MRRVSVILFLTIILLPVSVLAQGEPGFMKHSLGVTGELSVPVGDFSEWAGIGYGGMVKYQYGVDGKTAATFSAGYLVWSKKDLGAAGTIQPKAFEIMGGGKFYFAPDFFGSIEGGLYFLSYDRTGTTFIVEATATRFMMPVGVGWQKNGFEIGARYYIFNIEANNFSFTLGYNWTL